MSTTTDVVKNPTLSQPAQGAPARVGVAKIASAPSGDKLTANMSLGSQVTVGPATQEGYRTLEGCNPGNHIKGESVTVPTDQFKTQAAPRNETADIELEGV